MIMYSPDGQPAQVAKEQVPTLLEAGYTVDAPAPVVLKETKKEKEARLEAERLAAEEAEKERLAAEEAARLAAEGK